MKPSGQFTSIGGQAVIEGVMMRSPHFIAVAVRKSDQKIVIRFLPYSGWSEKFPVLKKPVLRGVVTLLESMIQGIDALSYSANVTAGSENSDEKLSNWAIASSIFTAFVLGMGLFVALPHLMTVWMTSTEHLQITARSPLFHLVDGGLKLVILLSYVYLIALMKDIHRVFQYHGAEHKSIYAFEAGEALTVENARKYTTLHPRCGTSFLLFLVLISVVVFSILFPVLGLTEITSHPILNHMFMILMKIALMLPVAGFAYELIKASASRMNHPIFKILMWPGMTLQRLTTREPSDDQLEVALASLKQVLKLEKAESFQSVSKDLTEVEIGELSDLGWVHAHVAEFPEA
jgi:uncharacterized protein YqhQ